MTGNSEKITTEVLGIPLYRLGMDAAIRAVRERAERGLGGYACFVNVHSAMEADRDSDLMVVFRESTFAFPDGVPLVWASRLGKEPVKERVCGPDFMTNMLQESRGERFGFIGGHPGQAESIVEKFGIESVAYCPPYRPFSEESAHEDWKFFLAQVTASGKPLPKYIWVCLGAPKQERWMRTIFQSTPGSIFFGVGAAIDFLVGEKSRAPVWMQKSGLEWLFRLLSEPRRLWRRYLVTNARFIARILTSSR